MNHFLRCLVLLACAGCGSATRAPLVDHVSREPCELREIGVRAADSAILTIRTPAVASDCVIRLTAARLRPWLGGPLAAWTVAVTTTATADTVPLTVTVRRLRGARARDALDAESVLVATEDLELVEYARAREDLDVDALPWDRLYLRVGGAANDSSGAFDPAAVRSAARRAEPLPECDTISWSPHPRAVAPSSRAVYLLGDRTGRELAERIVGVGNAREVVGLDSAAFDVALSAGPDVAYIVSLPLTGDLCASLSDVLRRAPWAARAAITPLLETRAYAITRRRSVP